MRKVYLDIELETGLAVFQLNRRNVPATQAAPHYKTQIGDRFLLIARQLKHLKRRCRESVSNKNMEHSLKMIVAQHASFSANCCNRIARENPPEMCSTSMLTAFFAALSRRYSSD